MEYQATRHATPTRATHLVASSSLSLSSAAQLRLLFTLLFVFYSRVLHLLQVRRLKSWEVSVKDLDCARTKREFAAG